MDPIEVTDRVVVREHDGHFRTRCDQPRPPVRPAVSIQCGYLGLGVGAQPVEPAGVVEAQRGRQCGPVPAHLGGPLRAASRSRLSSS